MSGIIIPIFRLPGIHDSVGIATHKNTQNRTLGPTRAARTRTSTIWDDFGTPGYAWWGGVMPSYSITV